MIASSKERGISLEYLSEEKFMPFSTTDEYFAQPPMDEDYPFAACGQTRRTTGRHIRLALQRLRQEMEVIVDEQATSLRYDNKGA